MTQSLVAGNLKGLGIVAIILFITVVFSGCVEEQNSDYQVQDTPQQVQVTSLNNVSINGNYKVQDVSCSGLKLNGNSNEITILNADVSMIRVNGNYNTIYYPNGANPVITENGIGNEILSQ